MDVIFEKFTGAVGIADNIAAHGATEKDHNLMLVARQHGLLFNLDKCHINQDHILRHII